MAKDKISDYSATAASNTDVGGVNIQGSAPAANIDNAFREVMSHLAEMNAGTFPVHDTFTVADPVDTTKRARLDAGGVSAGNTRVLSSPNVDGTLYVTASIVGGVGTATQSVGVPTGVIIEKVIGGANGDYVRFADGTQICTWQDAGIATNTATGSIFEAASAPTWTFPAAFTATTNLAAGGCTATSARWVAIGTITTTTCTYNQKSSVTSGTGQVTRLMAIGRWY